MIQSPKTFADLVGYAPTPMPLENEVHGTTVLALEYDGGVLMFADRRATMGNLIMFDLAEKVIALDDQTVVAISGSFARSIEICRLLKHSFKYYRRMHLTPMSLEGKLQEISRALASNLGAAMSGGGIFVPILAAYDPKHKQFGVYFFDPAGARFQNGAFAAAGSGSERIRGIFDYVTQTKGPFDKMKMEDALAEGLHMLKIAAALDSATGGIDHNPPIVRVLDAEGNRELDPAVLAKAIKKVS
jgi:proteasome beta subunit